jgi:hypothetical protein
MLWPEALIAIVVDVARTLFVDALSGRLAQMCGRFRGGPRGMPAVHRHIRRQCRRKLRKRLST